VGGFVSTTTADVGLAVPKTGDNVTTSPIVGCIVVLSSPLGVGSSVIITAGMGGNVLSWGVGTGVGNGVVMGTSMNVGASVVLGLDVVGDSVTTGSIVFASVGMGVLGMGVSTCITGDGVVGCGVVILIITGE